MRRLVVCALAALSLAAAAGPALAGKKDDTLVWVTDKETPIINSSYLNSREMVIIGTLVNDRLVHLDEKYNPVPLLATGWTWVNDATISTSAPASSSTRARCSTPGGRRLHAQFHH